MMKTLMIAAPSSGSGKTTITMGLIRALKNRGVDVVGYKIGPDYIDPAFLTSAAAKPARNLDLHLQGEQGILYNLERGDAEYGIIEGVMGYFDGISNTWQNSSYHLSTLLKTPTVLIYTPKGEMFSAIPKIKGMAEFGRSMIRGVVFNNVSQHYYELLKSAVEQHTNLAVLGFVPKMDEVELKSRHLGLIQSVEIHELDRKIEHVASVLSHQLDMERLLKMMAECHPQTTRYAPVRLAKHDMTVAVARDEAFSFYYTENLELLEQTCRVVYFSPLRDASLPPCDFVYLGGGYPEVFHLELSENLSMVRSMKEYVEQGGFIYAECGGFMYLTESVEDAPMVGIFPGKTRLTPRLQRFGYVDITLKQDCLLGQAGTTFTGHEFHKSVSNVTGNTVFHIKKTQGSKTWECGFRYKNVIAGYPHINFLGHPGVLNAMLDTIEKGK